ncbi:MAG: hypothetical protein QM744_14485 [Mesorhizobium sp.]
MKNWSISNPKAVKLDWHAMWRNWFRKRIEERTRAPPSRSGSAWNDLLDAEALEQPDEGNLELHRDATGTYGVRKPC